ncbi:Replication factor C subunit 4, partial [Smittium mucronatum]
MSQIVDAYKLPWVEKYRPTRISEIVGNEETLARLHAISSSGNMPNLILSGAPGIGKTTSIGCLANELLLAAAGPNDSIAEIRGRQYDDGGAAGPTPNYGDIQQLDTVRT